MGGMTEKEQIEILHELSKSQKSRIEELEIRISRAVGKLTYYIESRERIPSDSMKDIRNPLRGL